MYLKKSKQKKFVGGGILAAQIALEAGKGLYGAYQTQQAQRELGKLKPVGSTVGEYEEILKKTIESDVQRQRDEMLAQQMATSVQALQGLRGGAAQIPALTRQFAEAQIGMSAADQARELDAMSQVAGAKERQQERDIMQYERRRGELAGAMEGGIQNIAGALGGSAQALTTFTGAKQTEGLLKALNALEGFKGGFRNGGMMTGGKFSHKANPIDIVQKGEKIGEMTGGEVILNPKQQAAIASQSPYFKRLLKKFNKKK
jgi:hypothetical protein